MSAVVYLFLNTTFMDAYQIAYSGETESRTAEWKDTNCTYHWVNENVDWLTEVIVVLKAFSLNMSFNQ